MPRKKKLLELPAQASQDLNTIKGVADRWAGGVEDVAKDAFSWAKKHKFLVMLSVGAFMAKRYWLDEPTEKPSKDEEEY